MAQIFENHLTGNAGKKRMTKFGKYMSVVMVFMFVNFAWIFFRAETVKDAWYVFTNMFSGFGQGSVIFSTVVDRREIIILTINLILLFLYDLLAINKNGMKFVEKIPIAIRVMMGYAIITDILVIVLNGGGSNQFVYFQF